MKSVRTNQLSHSIVWWLLVAIGFFLPTQLGRHFFPAFSLIGGVRVDYLAPTFYFIDFFLIALIVLNQPAVGRVLHNRWFQTFVLVSVLNVLFSQLPLLSMYWLARSVEAVWVAAIVAHHANKVRQGFWVGSLAGAVFQLVLVILQLVLRHSVGGALWFVGERPLSTTLPDIAKVTIAGVEYLRPYGTFSHPNAMGGYYALLAIAAWLLCKSRLRFGLVGLGTLLVILSLSRGALAALAIGFGVWAYQRFEQKHRAKMGIVTLMFLGVGLLVFSRFVLSDPLALQKRVALLQQAGALFLNSPIMGVGRGAYVHVQAEHDFGYPYFFVQPVHSVFMLYLVEMGLVGLVWIAGYCWQMRRYLVRAAPVLAVVVVSGMVDHYWLTLIQNWHLMWIVGVSALGGQKRSQ